MLTYRAVLDKAILAYVFGQLAGLALSAVLVIATGDAAAAEPGAANPLERFWQQPMIVKLAVLIPVGFAMMTLAVTFYLSLLNILAAPIFFGYAVPAYIYLANRGYRGYWISVAIAAVPALVLALIADQRARSFFALLTLACGTCIMALFHWLLTRAPARGGLTP